MIALIMSVGLLPLLWNRFITALTTAPSLSGWGLTLGILALYGGLALIIGRASQFLRWNISAKNWRPIIIQAFFAPALIEEIGFRILFLPHASERVSLQSECIWGGLSLCLFLLYHPLNALTFYQAGYPTFFNATFLVLATLLGIACTLAYVLTGSLWPPVLIHWIVVVVWLCWLGGGERLTQPQASAIDE